MISISPDDGDSSYKYLALTTLIPDPTTHPSFWPKKKGQCTQINEKFLKVIG